MGSGARALSDPGRTISHSTDDGVTEGTDLLNIDLILLAEVEMSNI